MNLPIGSKLLLGLLLTSAPVGCRAHLSHQAKSDEMPRQPSRSGYQSGSEAGSPSTCGGVDHGDGLGSGSDQGEVRADAGGIGQGGDGGDALGSVNGDDHRRSRQAVEGGGVGQSPENCDCHDARRGPSQE